MQGGRLQFILSRLGQTVIVLWIIVTILFFIFRLMPGSPLVAYIDVTFTLEQQNALKHQFGLDKPLSTQYLLYLKNTATGNFGTSFFRNEPVFSLLMHVFPNTLLLTGTALLMAYVVGLIGGAILAWRRGTKIEGIGIVSALVTRSAPEFFIGMLALTIFAFHFRWFPSQGASSPGVIYGSYWKQIASLDFWRHLFLPAVTLAIYLTGLPLLLMRSNMLELLDEDFVVMARMKGLSERRIMLRHAARNALLPVVTVMALGVAYAVGGDVVLETVFSWPGIGRLLFQAITSKDYPLAQGAFFLLAVVVIVMNLVADILYSFLDPRASSGSREMG